MKRLLVLALVPIASLAIAFVCLELVLQILGWIAPHWISRAGSFSPGGDAVTILCVGDSHTYGSALPEAASYPAQLQERLDALDGQATYRVINLGIPGINTAMIAHRFEENLLRYRPDLVILWAGANNVWNEKESAESGEPGISGDLRRLLLRLKLVRLVRFLRSEVATAGRQRAELLDWQPEASTAWRLGDQVIRMEHVGSVKVSEERAARTARRDLTRMVELTRARGIAILLVTYPYVEFPWINDATHAVARKLDAEVLDTIGDRQRALADGHSPDELIVMAAGPHPRKLLYRYIVDSMVPRVLALLAPDRG